MIALAVLGAGCLDEPMPDKKTSAEEAAFTESNQERLTKSNPAPSLDHSLERQNLIDRLEILNNQNKMFYIYLISHGQIIAEYTLKGKVSSVNSKLTTQQQIIESPYYKSYQGGVNYGMVVESPALDGSYGTNGDGIFFFTDAGAFIEWNGEYHLSDYPLALTQQPLMTIDMTPRSNSKQVEN